MTPFGYVQMIRQWDYRFQRRHFFRQKLIAEKVSFWQRCYTAHSNKCNARVQSDKIMNGFTVKFSQRKQ